MATAGVTPQALSPSAQTAFGWARAATPPEDRIPATALLFGVLRTHAGSSEPEALMAHLRRPLSDLVDAMHSVAPDLDLEVSAPVHEDPFRFDNVTAEIVSATGDIAVRFDAFKDGRIHVPHLFGGIVLRPGGALERVLGDTQAKAAEDYLQFLDALTQNPSLHYADFLASHPLLVATPVPPLADPFVGREMELAQIRDALAEAEIVAISGPRGSGKTALALQAASEIVDAFAGGLVYVDARRADAESAIRAAVSSSRQAVLVVDNAGDTPPDLWPSLRGPAIVIEPVGLDGRPRIVLRKLGADAMRRLLRAQTPALVEHDVPMLMHLTAGLPYAAVLIGELLAAGLSPVEVDAEAAELHEQIREAQPRSEWPDVEARFLRLPPHLRRAFMSVGLLEGAFSTAQAAAATGEETAEMLLADLAATGLVDDEAGGWALPEPARSFALGRLGEAPDVERQLRVLQALVARHLRADDEPPSLAGLRSDEPALKDRIGFDGDVNALCSVLIAKKVDPPISVGLFGEWGTGKSTFMRLMRDRIRALQEDWSDRDDSPFCGRVKQITFNAWNYSDANLWASLVTKIFDGLAAPDPEVKGDPALNKSERAAIANVLETAKATIAEKEVERGEAVQREKELSRRLETIRRAEQDAGQELNKIRPAQVIEKARESKKLQGLGNEVLEQVGKTDGGSTQEAIAVARELRSTWGFAAHAAALLGRKRTAAVVVLTIAVVAVAGTLEVLGVPVAGTALAIAAWIGGLARLIRPAVGQARDAAAAGADLLAGLREEEQAAVRREEAKVERKLAQLAARRAQLDAELQDARSAAARADREIEDIRSGRRIAQFVEERAASADYREYLGLIALIRRDFDELTRLLLDEAEDVDKPPFDRIILYIDDLDRCRAELVVQVLEAVHLLLALRLFVVVVGVDPRWLAESLKHHYIGQLGLEQDPADAAEDWATTPQNYLEKIFQIPFALRPMGTKGFSDMMHSLFEVRTVERKPDRPDVPVVQQADTAEHVIAEPAGNGAPPADMHAPSPVSRERTLELLRIWPAELEFIQRLGALSPTPRAANRLANTYRLIRVGQDVVPPAQFVARDGEHGQYRIALVLLAVVVGFSEIADDVLTRLRDGKHRSFWAFVDDLAPPPEANERTAATYARLRTALKGIKDGSLPADIELYRTWVPYVGRYSFETARIPW